MKGRYTTVAQFHVRTVSLRQLAALWSTVMALVPVVRAASATFERRGQPTEHEYVYRDADELARAGLEVAPGELRLQSVRVLGSKTSVDIRERTGSDFVSAVLGLPNMLCVDIAGSNERDVLRIRAAVGRWVARNLTTTRRALWLKLGVLAAGIVAIWVGAAALGFPASQAIAATALWIPGVLLVSFLQFAVPTLRRRTLQLRIVADTQCAGAGRGASLSVTPDPESGETTDTGTEPTTAREGR